VNLLRFGGCCCEARTRKRWGFARVRRKLHRQRRALRTASSTSTPLRGACGPAAGCARPTGQSSTAQMQTLNRPAVRRPMVLPFHRAGSDLQTHKVRCLAYPSAEPHITPLEGRNFSIGGGRQAENQRKGKLTEGIVNRIPTKSPHHPHGIKVMLETGAIGSGSVGGRITPSLP